MLIGCRVKANCPLVGPGPVGGVLSMGVFLRDSSLYLRDIIERDISLYYELRELNNRVRNFSLEDKVVYRWRRQILIYLTLNFFHDGSGTTTL